MANGSPSMLALLGLLAVAGYQNRDKLGQMLNQVTGANADPARTPAQPAGTPTPGGMGGLGGLLGGLAGAGGLGGLLQSATQNGGSAGGVLSGGLGDLLDHLQQNGHGDTAQSWVNDGPDKTIPPQNLGQAIGPDILAQLERSTGLSKDDLLARLSQTLPKAVDGLTPDSRVPTSGEADQLVRNAPRWNA